MTHVPPMPPALQTSTIRTLRVFSVPAPLPDREGDELQDQGRPLAVFHGGRWQCPQILRRSELSDDL